MNRRNVILLILVAGLAAFLFLWDLPRERQEREREAVERRLTTIQASDLDTLRLHGEGDELTLARREDGWWLVSPVEEKANDQVADQHANFLANAIYDRVVSADVDTTALDAFDLGGLRPPARWIELATNDGQRVVYWVGRKNPTETSSYVRVAGDDRVLLMAAAMRDLVEVGYDSYRIYDLFPVDWKQIDHIEIKGQGLDLAAKKDERGLWFSETTPPRQVKRRLLRELAYDLGAARIQLYVQDEVDGDEWGAYGLHEPNLDIGFATPTYRGRLRVGNQDAETTFFARRNDGSTVLTVTGQVARTAKLDPETLWESNPVPDNYDLMDSVTVIWETGERITALRHEDDWAVRLVNEWTGEPQRFAVPVQNVVYGLEELESDAQVILASSAGRDEFMPVRKVRYIMYWPEHSVEGEVGWRRGEDAHWLQVNGEPTLYRIDRDLYFRLRGLLLAAELIDSQS